MRDTFVIPPYQDSLIDVALRRGEFQIFYPRRVITPPGYLNTKYVSSFFYEASILCGCMPHIYAGSDDVKPSAKTYTAISKVLLRNEFQTFWLDKELGEDLLRTQPPLDIPYKDFPWPFPAFIVMIPYGLVPFRGGYIPFVAIARDRNGVHMVAPALSEDVNTPTLSSTFLDDGRCDDLIGSMVMNESWFTTTGADTTVRTVMTALINLVVNMMFYMTSEGASITASVQQGKAKNKHDKGLWSPKWVGQYHRRDSVSGEPTSLTKRTHWRRGHWRNQAIGEGHSNHKRIWIKPMLINGNTIVKLPLDSSTA